MKKASLVLLGAAALTACKSGKDKPNILIIQCDQFATRALGAYGQIQGHTSVLDSLARHGVIFDNAYTACPLSQPSRTALLTGMLPHQTGVRTNSGPHVNSNIDGSIPTLGKLFSEAGYNAVHFGKRHDCGALAGFRHKEPDIKQYSSPDVPLNQDSFKDIGTLEDATAFLSSPGKEPFICMVDFQNPHNICGYVGTAEGPHESPDSGSLPPLPPNFEVEDWESLPIPIQYLCCNHRRLEQAVHWTDDNYREYIDAYLHYVDIVCDQIRQVFNALGSTEAAKNTVIVFLADHGDAMASHRMVTKHTDFYEEEVKVPLVFSGPGIVSEGKHIQQLVQTSTDLVPTLCEIAGIAYPSSMKGISMAPSVRGKKQKRSHEFIVSEWHSEYDKIVSPGRMVRSEGYKYTHYLEGSGEELYDLRSDPFEKHNLAKDPAHAAILEEHRAMLERHLRQTSDDYRSLEVKVAPQFRAHAPGYVNHMQGQNLWNYCDPTKPLPACSEPSEQQ